ncbi:MAG TPA: hypothetical protein VMW08_00655 [Acidimicrobiales bacterium]|nr:hypothetical protein [Acidimicrobiales bacterium]
MSTTTTDTRRYRIPMAARTVVTNCHRCGTLVDDTHAQAVEVWDLADGTSETRYYHAHASRCEAAEATNQGDADMAHHITITEKPATPGAGDIDGYNATCSSCGPTGGYSIRSMTEKHGRDHAAYMTRKETTR